MIDKDAEMEFLVNFINETTMTRETSREKLRILLAAYCIHHDLRFGSDEYASVLRNVWGVLTDVAVSKQELCNSDWSDFYSFWDYMEF